MDVDWSMFFLDPVTPDQQQPFDKFAVQQCTQRVILGNLTVRKQD